MGFDRFTDRELDFIALRTHGAQTPEIALKLGVTKRRVRYLLAAVYRKAGVNYLCLLTRWAMTNGLDEPLPPETHETRPHRGTPKPQIRQA